MQLVTSKINTLKNTYEKITSISIGKLNPSLSEKNVRNLNYKKLNKGKLCDKQDKNDSRIDTQGSSTFRTKNNDDINNRLNSFLGFSTILNNKNDESNSSESNWIFPILLFL